MSSSCINDKYVFFLLQRFSLLSSNVTADGLPETITFVVGKSGRAAVMVVALPFVAVSATGRVLIKTTT